MRIYMVLSRVYCRFILVEYDWWKTTIKWYDRTNSRIIGRFNPTFHLFIDDRELHVYFELVTTYTVKVDGEGQQFEMKLKYTWYKSMYEAELSIESHLKFLQPIVKDMLNEA